MAATTIAPPPEKVNGQATESASSSADPLDPAAADGKNAPLTPEEQEFLASGADAPSPDGGEVQKTESSGEGEEVAGEGSTESEGEEPEGDENAEVGDDEADAIFKDALRMAKGDPKRALAIAQAALGGESSEAGKTADEPSAGTIRERVMSEVSADVEKFYADAKGTAEKPGSESKALSSLLVARESALLEKVGRVLEDFDTRLQSRGKVKEDAAKLWKEYPTWVKNKAEFTRFLDADPARRGLPLVDGYELFLAKQTKRTSTADAKKGAAVKTAIDRKVPAANANVGGRASGPTERKTLTTEQREMVALRNQPRRFTLP